MPFRYLGLPHTAFGHLISMRDAELAEIGAQRMIADEKPGFPCRVTLADAEPGECVLLFSYAHQNAATPYKASGPVFVREAARAPYDSDSIPPVFLTARLLSARAYDAEGMMTAADVTSSDELEVSLEKLFAQGATDYVHVHYAKRGCFAARVERV
jgi:hypothetical protein